MCWLMARFSITYHIIIRFSARRRRRHCRRRLLYIFFLNIVIYSGVLLFTYRHHIVINKSILCTTLYVATINKNERARRFNDGGGVVGDLRK